MDDNNGASIFTQNLDLLRASLQALDKQAILRALLWLHGKAPYPHPTSIHLNLTLRCSARCFHCKQWAWPDHSEFTVSQLEKLFDIFESWGVKTVTFGGGNPLLHDHVALAIQMAHEANMQVGIVSEGVDMADGLADTICQYTRWIRFSLDGPNSDIHDEIRNSPGVFRRVIASVKKLQSRESQLRIGLNCVVQKSNLRTLSMIIDLAERIGVDVLLFKIAHGEDSSNRFLLSAEEWDQFAQWVQLTASSRNIQVETNLNQLSDLFGSAFHKDDAVRGRPVQSFYVQKQVHCFVPLFFLTCNSEGDMYPCDYLQADTRLWNGKYGEMRREFRLGNALEDSQSLLEKTALLMRKRIHGLPASGYAECGCCTRFCQLNTLLDSLDCRLRSGKINEEALDESFAKTGDEPPTPGFL